MSLPDPESYDYLDPNFNPADWGEHVDQMRLMTDITYLQEVMAWDAKKRELWMKARGIGPQIAVAFTDGSTETITLYEGDS